MTKALLLGFIGTLGAQTLSPETLARWLQERDAGKRHFLLVDVRTPGEHARGFIPGTDTLLPLQGLRQGSLQVPADPATDTVVLYCRTGRRSGLAQAWLRSQGFRWVFNAQGIRQWQQAGYDLTLPNPGPSSRVFVTFRDAGAVAALIPGDSLSAWPAGAGMTYVSVSSDGQTVLATSSAENRVYAFSATGELLKIIEVGQTPKGIKVAPGDTLALVAEEGAGTVGVLDLHRWTRVAGIPVGTMPHNLVFSPDGQFAYVTVQGSNQIAEIRVAQQEVTRTLDLEGKPHNLDITPDGTRLLVANLQSNDVAVVDLQRWKVLRRIPVSTGHHGIDITPDGAYALVTGIGADTLNLLSLATLERIRAVPIGAGPHGVRADATGRRAYVALARQNEVVEVALPSLRVRKRIPAGPVPFWIAVPGNP